MPIRSDNLAKFKGIITINSADVNPAEFDFSDASSLQAKLSNDRRASSILGMDFLMAAEGGLFSEQTSLKKVVGIFNLAQALTHRLMTTRGTMPGDSFFGVPWFNYLGRTYKNKDIIIANLREEIVSEILKDTRVGQIKSININFLSPLAIIVDVSLIPIFTSYSDIINIVISTGAQVNG
jgi:hypothetical protein